jgi:hypothetical protein
MSMLAAITVNRLLGNIAELILNPLIILGFTVATVFFLWNCEMIWKSDSSDLIRVK